MNKFTICCFSGHRSVPKHHISAIRHELRYILDYTTALGMDTFYTGGALGFDTLAAEVIQEVRARRHPHIKHILALPCPNQTKGWRPEDVARYDRIKERADEVVYVSPAYYPGCMHARNRYMVDHSDWCFVYLTKNTGGTYATWQYAKAKNVPVMNIVSHL